MGADELAEIFEPIELGQVGQAYWDEMTAEARTVAELSMIAEGARISDRLRMLDRAISGDGDTWATLVAARDNDEELVIRIDGALQEARQQATTLRQINAFFVRADAKPQEGATLADELAKAALRGRQTPRVESIPAWSTTAGDDAIDVATVGGRDVFPWQQYVVRNGMAKSDRLTMAGVRRWAAYEVAVLVARQNGKNGCIEVVELGWMINEPGVSILHTAHKFSTAMESMEKLETLIRSHPLIEAELLPGKKGVVRSHGFESIKFKNGSIIRFKTRTNMGARGFSVDRLIFDEAMDLSPASIKSLTPLLTTADNPQIWYLASAADVTDQAYCHKWASLRKRALRGADPALCWMEWSTAEPPELTSHEELLAWCEDRERWEESNPSLGYLLDEEYIENELAGMADQLPGFLVERLSVGNWPTDLAATPEYVIKPDDWSARTDPKPILRNDSAIGMDVSPDGLTCTIAAATFREDGGSHLELIYHGKSARVRQKDGTLRGPVDMAIAIWLKEKPRASSSIASPRRSRSCPIWKRPA